AAAEVADLVQAAHPGRGQVERAQHEVGDLGLTGRVVVGVVGADELAVDDHEAADVLAVGDGVEGVAGQAVEHLHGRLQVGGGGGAGQGKAGPASCTVGDGGGYVMGAGGGVGVAGGGGGGGAAVAEAPAVGEAGAGVVRARVRRRTRERGGRTRRTAIRPAD